MAARNGRVAIGAFLMGCAGSRQPAATTRAMPPADGSADAPIAAALLPPEGGGVEGDAGTQPAPLASTLGSTPRASTLGGSPVTVDPAVCGKAGLFLELPPSPHTTCPEPASCTLAVPLRIVNCSDEELTPTTLGLRSAGALEDLARAAPDVIGELASVLGESRPTDVRIAIEGARTVPPKSVLKGLEVQLRAGARWELELFATSVPTPGMFSSARGSTQVIDRTLVDATVRARAQRRERVTACRARGGSFEMVGGLAASEQCVFPFPDAGHACHDKAQCRGECLLTAAISLPSGKVRLDGVCSRLDVTFGCHVRIGNTPRGAGIVGREDVPPSLCVD